MTAEDVAHELERLALDQVAVQSEQLADGWVAAGVGIEAVAPVLRFMEESPACEFGTPGALVHFVERFHGKGYEDLLIESIRRRPTSHTVWMLNRILNATREPERRRRLIDLLREARDHPLADTRTIEAVALFLQDRSS